MDDRRVNIDARVRICDGRVSGGLRMRGERIGCRWSGIDVACGIAAGNQQSRGVCDATSLGCYSQGFRDSTHFPQGKTGRLCEAIFCSFSHYDLLVSPILTNNISFLPIFPILISYRIPTSPLIHPYSLLLIKCDSVRGSSSIMYYP